MDNVVFKITAFDENDNYIDSKEQEFRLINHYYTYDINDHIINLEYAVVDELLELNISVGSPIDPVVVSTLRIEFVDPVVHKLPVAISYTPRVKEQFQTDGVYEITQFDVTLDLPRASGNLEIGFDDADLHSKIRKE